MKDKRLERTAEHHPGKWKSGKKKRKIEHKVSIKIYDCRDRGGEGKRGAQDRAPGQVTSLDGLSGKTNCIHSKKADLFAARKGGLVTEFYQTG